MGPNYYGILGVPTTATASDIKEAYRRLAKKYHPDHHLENKGDYTRKFREIRDAYGILSDPTEKKKYDLGRSDKSSASPVVSPVSASSHSSAFDQSLLERRDLEAYRTFIIKPLYELVKQNSNLIREIWRGEKVFRPGSSMRHNHFRIEDIVVVPVERGGISRQGILVKASSNSFKSKRFRGRTFDTTFFPEEIFTTG